GIEQSTEDGQDFAGQDVWGKDIVLAYLAPNPNSPRTMTLVLTFENKGRQVIKWRENSRKADAIEVCEILVEELVSEFCGYLLKDAIA
ncbi:unnamed protein product, partial [marine sediment metagenome]